MMGDGRLEMRSGAGRSNTGICSASIPRFTLTSEKRSTHIKISGTRGIKGGIRRRWVSKRCLPSTRTTVCQRDGDGTRREEKSHGVPLGGRGSQQRF